MPIIFCINNKETEMIYFNNFVFLKKAEKAAKRINCMQVMYDMRNTGMSMVSECVLIGFLLGEGFIGLLKISFYT
jgi:hypothetical protein